MEGVFEQAMANLRKEVGINLFSRPYTPNGLAIVDDDEIGAWCELQIGPCTDKTMEP